MDIVFPRKQRFSGHDFTKYATNRPNINCSSVFRTIKEQLWCPVPTSDNILGHEICFRCRPCQSEVSNFKVTTGIEKQVTGLEITVQDTG